MSMRENVGGRGGRAVMCLVACSLLALLSAGCHSMPGRAEGDALGSIPPVTYSEKVYWYHNIFFWTKPLPRAVVVRRIAEEVLSTRSLQVTLTPSFPS